MNAHIPETPDRAIERIRIPGTPCGLIRKPFQQEDVNGACKVDVVENMNGLHPFFAAGDFKLTQTDPEPGNIIQRQAGIRDFNEAVRRVGKAVMSEFGEKEIIDAVKGFIGLPTEPQAGPLEIKGPGLLPVRTNTVKGKEFPLKRPLGDFPSSACLKFRLDKPPDFRSRGGRRGLGSL